MVRRIKPAAKWEDLSYPKTMLTRLRKICADFTPGKSLACLFVGERGTRKTMAAEVIANQLRLDLFRIDVSAAVSKYIGETEKNLRRIFDAAEAGGTVLFFDEADALFGKRSDVKDSHDRYANAEIDYLMQLLQSHRGLAILATNLKSNVDPPFLRRFNHVIDFRDLYEDVAASCLNVH